MKPEVREILQATDALLPTPDAWWNGWIGNTGERLCLGQALDRALVTYSSNHRIEGRTGELRTACQKALGFENGIALVAWNDTWGRTFADVKERLADALKEA
jgi:hypothetical protein